MYEVTNLENFKDVIKIQLSILLSCMKVIKELNLYKKKKVVCNLGINDTDIGGIFQHYVAELIRYSQLKGKWKQKV
jgi:hypothetical protein